MLVCFNTVDITVIVLSAIFGICAAVFSTLFTSQDGHYINICDIRYQSECKPDSIPTVVMFVFSLFCPAIAWGVTYNAKRHWMTGSADRIKEYTFWRCLLYFGFGVVITMGATNLFKVWLKVPRPCAIWMCDVPGFKDAVQENSLGKWLQEQKCDEGPQLFAVADCPDQSAGCNPTMSYPSGHASNGAYTFTMLGIYFRNSIPYEKTDSLTIPLARVLLTVIIVLFPIFVSLSRVKDLKHTSDDIVVGLLMGYVVAFGTWEVWLTAEKLEDSTARGDADMMRPDELDTFPSPTNVAQNESRPILP